MTVSAQTLAFEYTANGVTTTFPYQCRILFVEQLKVYVDGVLQVGGYTVFNVGNQNGGDIVFSAAPANGATVLIRRISDRVRTTDFQQAPYFTQEELLDLDQDYQTMLLQEAAAEGDKSIRIPSEETVNTVLPSAAERAGKQITFGPNGEVQLTNTSAAVASAELVFSPTKAAADTLAASLPDGATVIVDRDETRSYERTRYTVASAALTSPVDDTSFVQAGTGAVTLTMQDKARQTINVNDYGADPTGTLSSSAAFIKARTAAAGRKITASAGRYKLDAVIASSEDFVFEGDGDNTILDFSGTVTGGNYGIEANGSLTQIEALSGSQAAGLNTVLFASAPSLSVGDVFIIFNPTDYSWSGFRANYKAGEWCEVESISGNTVTTKNPLYDTYAAADVDVYKVTSPVFSMKNCAVLGTTILGLIRPTLCINPLIENVKGDHENNSIISLARCYNATINNPNMRNVGDGGDDYGISVGNSQHVRINGGNIYSRRHAVTTGGGNEIGCVPCRDIVTNGSVLKNDISANTHCADFHGNTEDSQYVNCKIYGGASLQGKDNEYTNCAITATSFGSVMYHAEVKGGRLGAVGCKFSTSVNPQPISRGIYDIGGQNSAVSADTTLDATFYVKGCSLHGRNLSSNTYFAYFTNSGATVKTNIEIDSLAGDVDVIANVLRTNLSSGTAASDFIIVDGISGFPSGTLLHNASGAHYTNFPHRLQKQTGSVTLSAVTGTATTIAAPINFKYLYPRTPSAQATSVGGYVGTQLAYATLFSLSTAAIRPMIATGDSTTTWSATADRVVCWTASIDEA